MEEQQQEQQQEEQAPAIDMAEFEALKAEKEAMASKLEELLGETKKAKAARREAEETARREAEERAKKAGDFEQLHKSSEEQRAALQKQLEELQQGISREKQQSAAMKIAGELAEGHNAELLAEFVGRRLKYTDDGLKVTDSNGNLTVSSIDDLKKEFAADTRYQSLLRGNQSSGGGAHGAGKGSGGSGAQQLNRDEFGALNPADKMKFIQGGGVVTD